MSIHVDHCMSPKLTLKSDPIHLIPQLLAVEGTRALTGDTLHPEGRRDEKLALEK
jgi:hypothetical protein